MMMKKRSIQAANSQTELMNAFYADVVLYIYKDTMSSLHCYSYYIHKRMSP